MDEEAADYVRLGAAKARLALGQDIVGDGTLEDELRQLLEETRGNLGDPA